MNVLVLTNSCTSLPSLEFLANRQLLSAVYAPLPATPDARTLSDWAASRDVPFFWITEDDLAEELSDFTTEFRDHLVLTFGFPWKLPAAPGGTHHCYNVHFSLLPAYAGPMPVFWQLRDGCVDGGVTLHQVTERFDSGPVFRQAELQLIPGETAGLYSARLAAAAVPLIRDLVQQYASGSIPALRPQGSSGRSYHRRPRAGDLYIRWHEHSAAQIEALVNAANPVAGGAIAYLRNQPVRILEITPADGSVAPGTPGGTIVHADAAQGLFVACADGGLLRLNVLQLREGWLSGAKLAALGIRAGDHFDPAPEVQQSTLSPFLIHQ